VATRNVFWALSASKIYLRLGLRPTAPLGELTVLPQTPSWWRGAACPSQAPLLISAFGLKFWPFECPLQDKFLAMPMTVKYHQPMLSIISPSRTWRVCKLLCDFWIFVELDAVVSYVFHQHSFQTHVITDFKLVHIEICLSGQTMGRLHIPLHSHTAIYTLVQKNNLHAQTSSVFATSNDAIHL